MITTSYLNFNLRLHLQGGREGGTEGGRGQRVHISRVKLLHGLIQVYPEVNASPSRVKHGLSAFKMLEVFHITSYSNAEPEPTLLTLHLPFIAPLFHRDAVSPDTG